MTSLHIAAIVAGVVSSGCVGLALGCAVTGDRRAVGQLSLAVGCLFGLAAVVFVWV